MKEAGPPRSRMVLRAEWTLRAPVPPPSSVPRIRSQGLGRTLLGGPFPSNQGSADLSLGSSARPSRWNPMHVHFRVPGSYSKAKSRPGWSPAGPAGASKQGPALLAPGRALHGLSPLHTPNRINYIFKRCRPAIPGEPGEPSITARPRFTSCRIVLTLVKRIFIFH